jgi:putative Mg2+ transporter-C (MgtC) family protein
MLLTPEMMIKIALAVVAGGLVGLEREFRDKAAGFRTLIFICVGATLFTIYSLEIASSSDPARIAANIVSGVGFLGAGVILREGGRVTGLTTASTIWLTAAIGMGLGAGQYALSGFVVLITLVVLWIFPRLEQAVDNVREERTYEIVCALNLEKILAFEALFSRCGLRLRRLRQVKEGGQMLCSWRVMGSHPAHEQLVSRLFEDPEVIEFRF